MIVFSEWAKNYDFNREYNSLTLQLLIDRFDESKPYRILDFGCGTGNYLKALSDFNQFDLYGLDQSQEMLDIATKKVPEAKFSIGNHKSLPYKADYFNLIYAIEVIHHISEIEYLFSQVSRVLLEKGHFVISTSSIEQLSTRPWNKYFPDAMKIHKQRFHGLQFLIELADNNKLKHIDTITIKEERTEIVPEWFVETAKKKLFSFFYFIDKDTYNKGLQKLTEDFYNKKTWHWQYEETTLVFKKSLDNY